MDSVLTFVGPSGMVDRELYNMAISPWIDLKAGGDIGSSGRFLSYSVYNDLEYEFVPNGGWVYTIFAVQYYPYEDPCTGLVTVSPLIVPNIVSGEQHVYCSPSGSPRKRNMSSWIPAGAEQVRVGIGVFSFCNLACPPPTRTPWFDNIRFGVWRPGGTSDAGPPPGGGALRTGLGPAAPNPMHRSTTLAFMVAERSPRVELDIFDVTGRHVRALVEGPLEAGPHEVTWDGLDAGGRPVAGGVYYYRLAAGSEIFSRSLVVVR
jgi:hypothetical protein